VKLAGIELPSEELMDALSLARERVRGGFAHRCQIHKALVQKKNLNRGDF
jgi:hypothetical protein